MGQIVMGLLYGCEAPELPTDEDNEGPDYDLFCRWEKAKKIDWHSKKPKVHIVTEGGKPLWGAWVAIGGSGQDDAPYFLEQCLTLEQVPRAFAKDIAKARKLWECFAAWVAKNEKIDLPTATLWLTPCETA